MAEPITLEFLKQHARITTALEDDILAVYLTAARQRAETYCNTQFVTQDLSWGPYPISQACPIPLADIVEVSGYYTTVQEVADAYDYYNNYRKGIIISRELTIDDKNLPTYAVKYTVTVDPADVPAAVKVAIARIAADFYENRENSGTQELGITAKTMLAAYRNI